VCSLHWQNDHRPEHAFAERTFSPQQEEGSADCPSLLRPTLLFDQPRPLTETIRILHGPERIQSGWWTDQPICRDYFIARNTAQQTLWVFRDGARQWFVHGWFA
jgi:hypothetical protein